MTDLKDLIIACVITFVLGAGTAGVGAWKYQENRWTATVATQKQEAAQVLANQTAKVLQAERKYDQFKTEVEKSDEIRKTQVESVLRDNRRLARELGGLRDPGRRPSGDSSVPSTPGTACQCSTGPAEGKLSDEATEFLLEFAAEADRAATYAQTCHDWAIGIKKGSASFSTSP